MREENVSGQEPVNGLIGEFFDSCQKVLVQMVASEFSNQLIVIDLLARSVGDHVWVDDDLILLWSLLIGFIGGLLTGFGGLRLRLGLGCGLLLMFGLHV